MNDEMKLKLQIGQFIDNQIHKRENKYLYQSYRKAMRKYQFKTENYARECHNVFLAYKLGLK